MSLGYGNMIIVIVLVIAAIGFFVIRNDFRYYDWIKTYWFYKRTLKNRLSFILVLAGWSILLFATLDIKGKPEKVPFDIPDQRTIILIDSSASMLAEDVKPNRFSKALLIARDFVRKSVGHQISIVLFSDIQKQIVPFTDDINFLDSKIASIESLNISKGGSNISQAMTEAVGYFFDGGDKISGNLLVFTDTEENEKGIDVKIPEGINVAVVGVGTGYGGPIPIRNSRGRFIKYKKFQGDRVLSKLNQAFLDELGNKIAQYKYWVALSYSIPTDGVVSFFHEIHNEKVKKGTIYKAKSYSKEVVLLGMCFLIAGLLLRFFKAFYIPIIMVLFISNVQANADYKVLSERFKSGELIRNHKLKMAELLTSKKQYGKAVTLYSEVIIDLSSERSDVLFNYGTARMFKGELKEGLDIYMLLKKRISDSIAIEDIAMATHINENIFLALNKEKKKGKGKSKKQKKGKKKEKNKKKSKSKKSKKSEKKTKDPKKGEKKSKPKKIEPPKHKNLDEKEKNLRKKRKLKKVPKVFNQLMKEDKNMQKKQMKTDRQRKRSSFGRKDW